MPDRPTTPSLNILSPQPPLVGCCMAPLAKCGATVGGERSPLHAHGYADPNNGHAPIPAPPNASGGGGVPSGTTWMAVLTKTLWLE